MNEALEPEGECFAVVISHDCDIPHPHEPYIEVILAKVVDRADGTPDPQLSHAKNPRKLHLVYDRLGGGSIVLELQHAKRQLVHKEAFREHATRFADASLSEMSKRTLKQWLAARYGRPAFPNAFESRLGKRIRGKEVKRRIAGILKPHAEHLVGLFFDLGEQRGVEVPDGEPYALSITVAYDAENGASAAREAAERVAQGLQELFTEAYGLPEDADEIALDACEAVPDTHMTLADIRRVDQWRLEYLSLCDDEQENFLPDGAAPARGKARTQARHLFIGSLLTRLPGLHHSPI
ncbi:hypothetical protein [Marichromatium purpuratum]|uniref:hypothetical protein n=1 Tax=Marichromatium purpuratum TaxID=37487 RepID=UPI0018DC09E8|nr:hypothetical protein [Marichromatium purpuratum]